jgi:hypothetical protein
VCSLYWKFGWQRTDGPPKRCSNVDNGKKSENETVVTLAVR